MRITHLFITVGLAATLQTISLAASAAEGAIKVSSMAQVETEVVGKDGKKTTQRTVVEKAIPGTEIIFTNTFENVSDKPANDIIINNPIPNETEYKAGSAFGKDCEITFSADGGKTFGAPESIKTKGADGTQHSALPKEYTHIRWTYKKLLPSGKSGEVGFRSTIK